MNNKSKINTTKGKIYLTVVAIASLLVMALNVNTNSMPANAIDFGLISKDFNVGSIDTDSLFNCVGAAITCDNDNTVNNNIAIGNGTNGGDNPLTCEECYNEYLTDEEIQLVLGFEGTIAETCAATMALSPEEFANNLSLLENVILPDAGVDEDSIDALIACLKAAYEAFGQN